MSKTKTNLLMLALAVLTVVMPQMAFATNGLGSVGASVCRIYNCIVNNSLVLVIATVAIFFLGIGAFFGKVNWGLVIVITLGLVVIAGAMEIATMVLGQTSTGGCDTVSC